MSNDVKDNLKSGNTWIRGLYMLLFAFLYSLTEIVLAAVVIFQFGHKLLTGKTNLRLLNLGQSLATYIYQIILFLSFKSEEKPYPFEVWPKGVPATKSSSRSRSRKKPADESQENDVASDTESDGG